MTERATNTGTRAVFLGLAACLTYGWSSGVRANYGVLLEPIAANSGVDYGTVSLVLALAQLSFGVMQPLFGVLAMKRSGGFVLRLGAVLMALGLFAVPVCRSAGTLALALGFVLPAGTAALSFGLVMGLITPRLPEKLVSGVSGAVSASGGVGSTILSPVIQALAASAGLAGAMVFLGVPSLLLAPLSFVLCRPARPSAPAEGDGGQKKAPAIMPALRRAMESRDYWFLLLGFFTCGFHMAIVETHLFTQITTYGFSRQTAAYAFSAYGVAAMAGSVGSGALCGRRPMKAVLSGLYGARVAIVLGFLIAPKTELVIFAFAVLLGLTGSATVPPTAGLTERLFGAERLAALFGIVFLAHQLGSFCSAWLGGVWVSSAGGYGRVWLADALLCVLAAAVSAGIGKKPGRAVRPD